MNPIEPINDDHAVTSVMFSIHLDEFVEPRSIAEAMAKGSWRTELPAIVASEPVEIEQAGQSFEVPTAQFAILRPDGRPIWALAFNGYFITVKCTAYTRWAEVWGSAKRYLEEAFGIVQSIQTDLHILDYRLRVVDQFTTSELNYDASQLFQKGDFLGSLPFAKGGIWNSRVGWYEDEVDRRFFSSVGINAAPKTEADEITPPIVFTINHFQRTKVKPTSENTLEALGSIMESLHERNKDVMKRLLVSSVLERIGLVDQ